MTPEKNNSDSLLRVKNLIQQSQSMTLATASDNNPWAAPVYYATCGAGFYFFSNPNARHIKEALASGNAAAAIYAQGSAWQNLLGLQMSGKLSAVSGGVKASRAVLAYVKKFPIVKTFFSEIKNLNLNDFTCKFHAKLYCFHPDLIFFMDNSVEFGFREEIHKDTLFT